MPDRNFEKAYAVLRRFRSRIGNKNSRIHQETMEKNLHKQRALDGICGKCKFLQVRTRGANNSEGVQMFCKKGNTPIYEYAEIPLGQQLDCPDFKQK